MLTSKTERRRHRLSWTRRKQLSIRIAPRLDCDRGRNSRRKTYPKFGQPARRWISLLHKALMVTELATSQGVLELHPKGFGFLRNPVRHYVAPLGAWDAMVKSTLSASLMFLVLFAIPGLSLWTGVLLGAGVYFGALWGIRGMSREDRLVVWNALRGALFR